MTAFIAALATIVRRIPKVALFGAAVLTQIALLAAMVIDRMQVLRNGTEVTLQTRPVDPRDFLRGDYVVLGYDITEVAAGSLKDQSAGARNGVIFVKLRPNGEGIYEAASVHTDVVAVEKPEVLIRGRIDYGATCGPQSRSFCPTLRVHYNLEKYFVPEGEGRKLEQQLRDRRKVTVVAAVLPSGRAAIKRLLVDGKAVYDEPWF